MKEHSIEKSILNKDIPHSDENNKAPQIEFEVKEYAEKLAKEEKIKNSYEIINPQSINFVGNEEKEIDNTKEYIRRYTYETKIAGKNYNFFLTTIDGMLENIDSDANDQTEYYSTARIDFNAEGSEYLTNIGLSEINKSDLLIRDLIRFLYTQNKPTYLIVEASKSDLLFGTEKEIKNNLVKKIDELQMKKELPEGIFTFSENSAGYNAVSIKNGIIELNYINSDTVNMFTIDEFIAFLKSDIVLDNSVLREDIIRFITRFGGSEIKQQQRLTLYARKLSQIGFKIDRKEDVIYASFTDEAFNKLFDFSKITEEANAIINKYISETGKKDVALHDIRRWRNPRPLRRRPRQAIEE